VWILSTICDTLLPTQCFSLFLVWGLEGRGLDTKNVYRKSSWCFWARPLCVIRQTKIAFTHVLSKWMNGYCLCSKCLALLTKWMDNRGTLSYCFWSYRRFTWTGLVVCSVSSGTVEVVAVLSKTCMASKLALGTNVWWRNDITLKSALKKYLTYFRTNTSA